MKKSLENKLREAFRAGLRYGVDSDRWGNQSIQPDEDQYINSMLFDAQEEEKDIPVTYYQIRTTCGWSKWCDITGSNNYALNEGYEPKDSEIFYITKSQAKKLNF